MSAAPKCYVCGSRDLPADVDLRSPTCAACAPARDHVVSMQTAPDGGSLAACPCGWRSTVAGKARYVIQDVKVRLHWREVIRRSQTLRSIAALVDDHSAAFGGSRAALVRDGMLGIASIAVIFLNVVAIAAMAGGK